MAEMRWFATFPRLGKIGSHLKLLSIYLKNAIDARSCVKIKDKRRANNAPWQIILIIDKFTFKKTTGAASGRKCNRKARAPVVVTLSWFITLQSITLHFHSGKTIFFIPLSNIVWLIYRLFFHRALVCFTAYFIIHFRLSASLPRSLVWFPIGAR